MPLIRISVLQGRSEVEMTELLTSVHSAVKFALGLPDHDRQVRLDAYPENRFLVPPGKGPLYTLVEISMFAGRSLDAKRKLYRCIVENLTALGVPANDVFILLHEEPLENWGIRGGNAACDVDLGFQVKI